MLALAPTALVALWLGRLGILAGGRGVAKALLAGAASVPVAACASIAASSVLGTVVPEGTAVHHVLRCVLCVALVEETVKRVAAARVARSARVGQFALHVLVGLGFGAAEDALYVCAGASWLPRALSCIAGHPLYGVLTGELLDRSRGARGRGDARAADLWSAAASLVPTAVHGLFDALCMAEGAMRTLCVVCVLAMAVAGSVAFVRMVRGRAEHSK
ncbi:MAG: PrsW family glutamic-type intramembrane protease [Coriobacteriales bacterium]|nr:PrsW family glutamic-type intramembrane protease [Coriobacteriales bacterium]